MTADPTPAAPDQPCTCHPDDNPPKPCARQYAYSECVKAAAPASSSSGAPEPTLLRMTLERFGAAIRAAFEAGYTDGVHHPAGENTFSHRERMSRAFWQRCADDVRSSLAERQGAEPPTGSKTREIL